MRCLDSSFIVDLLAGERAAAQKAREFDGTAERLSIAAPALAEVLIGAHFRGGVYLRKALELVAGMDVLAVDGAVAAEAGELGAEMLRRGLRPAAADLLIAACARRNQKVLLTRDQAFVYVPGLAVETY